MFKTNQFRSKLVKNKKREGPDMSRFLGYVENRCEFWGFLDGSSR
jgi:hypothetical protein